MGNMDKFINFMKMGDHDGDYDDEYEVDENDDFEEEAAPRRRFGKSNASKDEYATEEEVEERQVAPKKSAASKVTSLRSANYRKAGSTAVSNNMEVVLVKPAAYDEFTQIIDALREEKSVVLNLEGLDATLARRIFDSATGGVYAINGRMEAISECVYVITPESVQITGGTNEDNLALGKGFFD